MRARKIPDGLLSTTEAAKRLGITRITLMKWYREGLAKPTKIAPYSSRVVIYRWRPDITLTNMAEPYEAEIVRAK